jgi:hypothetical protein
VQKCGKNREQTDGRTDGQSNDFKRALFFKKTCSKKNIPFHDLTKVDQNGGETAPNNMRPDEEMELQTREGVLQRGHQPHENE